MNLDTLINNLKTHIDRNHLTKAKVAEKIGVSPSGLSHLLSRKVNPTGEQALAILNLTKGNEMNSTLTTSEGPEDYALQNAAVLAKYAKNPARIKYFTSNTGWVPGETQEPDLAANVAE